MRPRQALALLIAFGVCAAARPARAARSAGMPGAYLDYAASPRALGLGRAMTAAVEGTDSVPWNPAGLANLKPSSLSLAHSQTQEGAYLENIGYAQPVYRFGGVGLNYIRLDSGSLPRTNEFNQVSGNFHGVEQTIMAGYGVNVVKTLGVGAAVKFSHQSIGDVSAAGWGLDLGILQALFNGFSWGARLQNAVAPSMRFASGADQFPRAFTTGAALRLWQERLTLTGDVEKILSMPEPLRLRFGAEGVFLGTAKIRLGYDTINKEFDVGVGYSFGGQSIDYASSNSSEGDYSQNIGYGYVFGGYAVSVVAKPRVFSPAGVRKTTTFYTDIKHSKKIYSWELQIMDQTGGVVRSIRGSGNPPPSISWEGANESGTYVPAGEYQYTMTVGDADGRKETSPAQTVVVQYSTPLDQIEIKSL